MTVWESVILGVLQGLTEFLPVSSSGHLVIGKSLLGLDEPGVTLEVLLHFSTLLSVFWVFGKDFLKLFRFPKDQTQRRFLFLLIVGCIPTAVIGLVIGRYADLLFKSTLVVGIMLLVTGGILLLITALPAGIKTIGRMQARDALWVGLLQGLAVIPGISRSGSTIMAALWRGLNRETAVRYSFMLAAPVILGAALLEMKKLLEAGMGQAMLINYMVGGLAAFIAGVCAIKIFIRLLKENKFHYFAYYCFAVGAAAIIASLLRG
jgi:undecaprenyl-diphosphatase